MTTNDKRKFIRINSLNLSYVLVIASMNIGSYVLTFAALSFLGLGAQQGYADWGQIISYSRNWQGLEFWYTIFFPALGMVLFVLAWNLIGDALRDVLDPRRISSGGDADD